MVGVLLAHLVGDYILQSDWMANEKTKRWFPAWAHGVTYGLPFLFVTNSPWALAVIVVTHVVIDRYRLAKYVIWAKNFIAPRKWWYSWRECSGTGYHHSRPAWLATWLLIIADNTIHLVINVAAVRYL
ncbi:hypothetical protein SEA_CRICKO_28 [Streptomyces phage CricKo]|nr:hypothetical protein SEA_RAINYDAI_28 [Streptomyces phage Rainydai]QJD49911.1 hypothetical protein SEA_CRICKO_28 [Streptomyces phage CricKo]QNL30643.1 membrane protein [Streptomyces phage Thiqqums]